MSKKGDILGLSADLEETAVARQKQHAELDKNIKFLAVDELCQIAESTQDDFVIDRIMARADATILGSLVKNEALKPKALDVLARKGGFEVWAKALGHPSISGETIEWMYSRLDKNATADRAGSWLVGWIAGHEKTPGNILADIAVLAAVGYEHGIECPGWEAALRHKELPVEGQLGIVKTGIGARNDAWTLLLEREDTRDEVFESVLNMVQASRSKSGAEALSDALTVDFVVRVFNHPRLSEDVRRRGINKLRYLAADEYRIRMWVEAIGEMTPEVAKAFSRDMTEAMLDSLILPSKARMAIQWIEAEKDRVAFWDKGTQAKLLTHPEKEVRIKIAGALGRKTTEAEGSGIGQQKISARIIRP